MNKFFLLGEDFLKALLIHLVAPQAQNVLPICDALRTLKAHEAAIGNAVNEVANEVENAVTDIAK